MENKKVAVITGGAKGIGRACAMKLASIGYDISLNYRSDIPDELYKEMELYKTRLLLHKADVSNFEEAQGLATATKEYFGRIDVLVNNAGITRDGLLMRMKESEFDDVLNTNLKGTFNMVRHVSRIMSKQRSGSIINISSVVGILGNIGQANYAASKAGIIGLTKSAAKELAPFGITSNAVAPGFIETNMTATLDEKVRERILSQIPLQRFGNAGHVAEVVAFLANHDYITGQVIAVDGGMS